MLPIVWRIQWVNAVEMVCDGSPYTQKREQQTEGGRALSPSGAVFNLSNCVDQPTFEATESTRHLLSK